MDIDGVLYIATGRKYVLAAIRSAKSVRHFAPNMGIHLFTDNEDFLSFNFKEAKYPFRSVEIIENPHRRSKVDYLMKTPFENTLYMDTDTAWNVDNNEIFRILERFDIALTHAMSRNTPNSLLSWRTDIPDAFPQFNGGVILYRKNTQVLQLLGDWAIAYKEAGLRHDQPTLRELLWLSDLRIATLPPEYNVRYLKYPFLWSKSEARTRIFHLKQFHHGWLFWLNKRTHTTRYFRKFGLGWLVNLSKKVKK